MGEKGYQEQLHPEAWRTLSYEQRVDVLQTLETDIAGQDGRAPCRVVPVEMASLGDCGEFSPKDWTIKINKDHIATDALQLIAVSTTLHEGRHAYQRAAVKDPALHQDKEEVQRWQVNFSVYVSLTEKSYPVYRFQPVERDADLYADNALNKIFTRLEQTHGPIESYRAYVTASQKGQQLAAREAARLFGSDYEVKIDQALHRQYEKEQALNAKKVYKIMVRLDGAGWRSKTVALDAADHEIMRRRLETQAKEFILAEAGRMGLNPDRIPETKARVVPLDREQSAIFIKEQAAIKEKGTGHGIEM